MTYSVKQAINRKRLNKVSTSSISNSDFVGLQRLNCALLSKRKKLIFIDNGFL